MTTFGPDPDHDFLATSAEHDAGTPPHDPDPDGDGLEDGLEVVRWLSDPFDPDTDNDTLDDRTEARESKTQLLDPDTDGDLYSDALEHRGLTVQGQQILAPSDPNDHSEIPTPIGEQRVPLFPLHSSEKDRQDLLPTPPVDQPGHWPEYVRQERDR